MSTMTTLPVLLIIAHQGFQPTEYAEPKRLLEETGIKVVTASNKPGIATTQDGKIKVDVKNVTTDKINPKDYSGIFIVGGPGAMENLDNQTTYKLLQEAAKEKIPFGSICISTRILAKAGVIEGKDVTGWNNDDELDDILKKHGANYIKEKCVVDHDGKIVTAVDPSAAQEFGKKIIEIIKK